MGDCYNIEFIVNDNENDLRCFPVPKTTPLTLEYLSKVLLSVQDELRGHRLSYSWRDTEDDELLIESDFDLNEAIQAQTSVGDGATANTNTNTLCFYVTAEDLSASRSQKTAQDKTAKQSSLGNEPKPLAELSVEEVCCVFENLHIPRACCALVREKPISGRLLACVESIDELRDCGLAEDVLGKMQAKMLLQSVQDMQESGVPPHFLRASANTTGGVDEKECIPPPPTRPVHMSEPSFASHSHSLPAFSVPVAVPLSSSPAADIATVAAMLADQEVCLQEILRSIRSNANAKEAALGFQDKLDRLLSMQESVQTVSTGKGNETNELVIRSFDELKSPLEGERQTALAAKEGENRELRDENRRLSIALAEAQSRLVWKEEEFAVLKNTLEAIQERLTAIDNKETGRDELMTIVREIRQAQIDEENRRKEFIEKRDRVLPRVGFWCAEAAKTNQHPLVLAARVRDIPGVKALLECTYDMGASDTEEVKSFARSSTKERIRKAAEVRDTLLYCASDLGQTRTVDLLISQKADIAAEHEMEQRTPLHIAAQKGNTETVSLLLKGKANIDAVERFGRTPLCCAAANGHNNVVSLLLDHNANLGEALHYAAENGHTETVSLLLAHRANIEVKDRHESTALHKAAEGGHTETAAFLITHRANVEAVKRGGRTPLCCAAGNGHTNVVSLLLDHKANILQRSLCSAAEGGHTETVDLLIAHRANIGAADEHGSTPLYFAAANNHSNVVSLLLKHKADIGNGVLRRAASWGRAETASLLIAHNANIDEKDKCDWTPLHEAALHGRTDVVDLLITHRASIEAMAKKRRFFRGGELSGTPLHFAALGDSSLPREVGFPLGGTQANTVSLLLVHRANPEARNEDGKTPLQLAENEDIRALLGTKSSFRFSISRKL